MHDLIISGGQVVGTQGVRVCDVAIQGERIVQLAPCIDGPCRRRIDARGLVVLPGLIDPHVHLGLPMKGTISSDDPESGTAAALFGGVTTIVDFTLQHPGQSLPESLAERLGCFEGKAHTDYALHVNVTDFGPGFEQRLGRELAEVAELGATSFKVFPCYSREGVAIGPGHLRVLLKAADAAGLLVLVHAEDDRILTTNEKKLVASGRITPTNYPRSRPPEAEVRAISDVITVALESESAVYFVHVSTAGGLQAILAGRQRSAKPIYLETCPQYLILDDSAYAGPAGAQFMVAPPLRAPENKTALLKALVQGHVDVVATDHCPFLRSQKDLPGAPFTSIPNGLPGVETRLALLHTLAVASQLITLEDLARLTATKPAEIFGLHPRKGCIAPGSDADLLVFDPHAEWVIRSDVLHMNTDFSPYEGFKARGKVRTVLLRGEVVVADGILKSGKSGRFIKRKPGPEA